MTQPLTNRHSPGTQEVGSLRSSMRGVVLSPSDTGYDAARTIFNGMIDRRPAVIARCGEVSDVPRALEFGVNHALPISICGGGHAGPGYAVCDDGVTIDLSGMAAVAVDAATKTARAQAGANWGQFD